LNSTITDIRRERELLRSDYDSLKEELDDNESKMNEAREQRENLQREYTELLTSSARNQRLSESNKTAFESEIVRLSSKGIEWGATRISRGYNNY